MPSRPQMTTRAYLAFGVVHFALTVLGGAFLPGLAVGMMDSGVTVAPWWFLALAYVYVAVSLPVVYPLMAMGIVLPWTSPGFYFLTLAALANSALVTAFVRILASYVGRRSRRASA